MNSIEQELKGSEREISYYLFKDQTLIKTIGDLAFIYNSILQEWMPTKTIEEYKKTNADYEVLKVDEVKEIIEDKNDIVFIKKELKIDDKKDEPNSDKTKPKLKSNNYMVIAVFLVLVIIAYGLIYVLKNALTS